MVSEVHLHESADDAITVEIQHARGEKCPRCWNYRSLGTQGDYPDVCERCAQVLREINYHSEC